LLCQVDEMAPQKNSKVFLAVISTITALLGLANAETPCPPGYPVLPLTYYDLPHLAVVVTGVDVTPPDHYPNFTISGYPDVEACASSCNPHYGCIVVAFDPTSSNCTIMDNTAIVTANPDSPVQAAFFCDYIYDTPSDFPYPLPPLPSTTTDTATATATGTLTGTVAGPVTVSATPIASTSSSWAVTTTTTTTGGAHAGVVTTSSSSTGKPTVVYTGPHANNAMVLSMRPIAALLAMSVALFM
jgi:PAN domain